LLSKASEEKVPSADKVEVQSILQELNGKIEHLLSSHAANILAKQYSSVVRDFQDHFSIPEQ